MVNVAGRSKGCSTCRRRRVKCDETQPICMRCKKAGRECDGPRAVTFIADTIVKSRRSPGTTTTVSAPTSPAAKSEGTKEKDVVVRNNGYRKAEIYPLLKSDVFELSICYSRTHLRPGAAIDLAMQRHRLANLVTAGSRPLELGTGAMVSRKIMRGNVATTTTTTDVFATTLLAFATIVHGTHTHSPQTLQTGYTLHAIALHTLNAALSNPSTSLSPALSPTSDAILLSIATLAILEVLVPTSPNAHLAHMLGLSRLLELRDPTSAAHTSSLSLALYMSVRHMLLFAALTARRACVLARPEWKALLRQACRGEVETREQELYDVLADCSVLCERRDRLLRRSSRGDCEAFQHVREEIVRKAVEMMEMLKMRRRRWAGDDERAYTEIRTTPSTMSCPADATVSESATTSFTVFVFRDEAAAALFMLYNTALIHVLRILASLPPRGSTNDTISIPSAMYLAGTISAAKNEATDELWTHVRDDYVAAERAAALDTCRCIPYYAACAPVHTSPVVHWAVMTAWATLRRKEFAEGKAMMEWVRTKCRQITATGLWACGE